MSYKIKSRIWLERNSGVFLGEGRVQLLKAVEETGSLSKAAKETKMSYKKAWKLLNAINKTAKEPIVITNVGGKNGGGTELTIYGKKVIRIFEDVNKECWIFLEKRLQRFNDL